MKNKVLMVLSLLIIISVIGVANASSTNNTENNEFKLSNNSSDFVVLTDIDPDVILEIRYYSTYNFVGDRIDGYEQPTALLTKEAATALKGVSDDLREYFYPELDKSVLFDKGYIANYSGHSRGSTVDLTLFDMKTGKEVDMGGTFDYFGERSHPDYKNITDQQYKNRMILREAMMDHGFKPLDEEWWHFTLENEPYPDTYFTFPVNESSVNKV